MKTRHYFDANNPNKTIHFYKLAKYDIMYSNGNIFVNNY